MLKADAEKLIFAYAAAKLQEWKKPLRLTEEDKSEIRVTYHALLDALIGSTPIPQMEGKVPLVLYFDTVEDANEFTDLIQAAKPGMKAVRLAD